MDVTGHYYGASFARSRKLPDLKRLLRRIVGDEQPAQQQTPEELLAVIESWNKLLGGEDETPHLNVKE